MATLSVKIQPSFAGRALTIAIEQMDANGVLRFLSEEGASAIVENNINYARATNVDLVAAGAEAGVLELTVRDDVGNIANTASESVDATGNILPPQSNAGFNDKLDTLLQDTGNIYGDTQDIIANLAIHDTDIKAAIAALQVVTENQPVFGEEYFMTITDTLGGFGDRAGITLTKTAPP